MTKYPMTVEGAESLKKELHQLTTVERPRLSKAIGEARELGDLKENAEYHAARELQGLSEARIRDIEHKLAHAQIIDVSKMNANGRVIFGCTVHLLNIDTEEKMHYKIVGEDEADLKHRKISITSPIARALIGKEVDDVVSVNTPGGLAEYEISKIEYI
jgi:transcription elongation factor GreA